jgi:hypothetical protein
MRSCTHTNGIVFPYANGKIVFALPSIEARGVEGKRQELFLHIPMGEGLFFTVPMREGLFLHCHPMRLRGGEGERQELFLHMTMGKIVFAYAIGEGNGAVAPYIYREKSAKFSFYTRFPL